MADELIDVSPDWAQHAYVDSAKYKGMYEASIDPAKFWGEHGKHIDWIKPYSPGAVRDVDYTGDVRIRWYHDGVLHTCPQAAFSRYQHVVRRELKIPDDEIVICGLALGQADPDAVPNNLITERAPLQDFTTWYNE